MLKRRLAAVVLHFSLLAPMDAGAAAPVCGDVNANSTVTSSDALLVLKKGVGQAITLDCSNYDNAISACQSSLQAANASLTTCSSDLAGCDADLATAASGLGACNSALTTCSGSLAGCDADLATATSGLGACNSALTTCSGSLAGCDASLATANTGLSACNSSLASCGLDLSGCYNNLVTIASDLGTCNAILTNCNADRDSCNADHDGCVASRDSCVLSLSSCTADLEACNGLPVCGDEVVSGNEECEDGNLNGSSCALWGFSGGTLSCGSGCALDFSGCWTERFDTSGDTILDRETGLEWERKDAFDGAANLANPHDADNSYTWGTSLVSGAPDGTLFVTFLRSLNRGSSQDGVATTGCYAGHCDWRLPTIEELKTLIDGSAVAAPYTYAAFLPTAATQTWTMTELTSSVAPAWAVAFNNGGFTNYNKTFAFRARAVRGGNP